MHNAVVAHANVNQQHYDEQRTRYHDRKATLVTFDIGQQVMLYDADHRVGNARKLQPRHIAGWTVTERVGIVNYRITNEFTNDVELVHVSKLRRYRSRTTMEAEGQPMDSASGSGGDEYHRNAPQGTDNEADQIQNEPQDDDDAPAMCIIATVPTKAEKELLFELHELLTEIQSGGNRATATLFQNRAGSMHSESERLWNARAYKRRNRRARNRKRNRKRKQRTFRNRSRTEYRPIEHRQRTKIVRPRNAQRGPMNRPSNARDATLQQLLSAPVQNWSRAQVQRFTDQQAQHLLQQTGSYGYPADDAAFTDRLQQFTEVAIRHARKNGDSSTVTRVYPKRVRRGGGDTTNNNRYRTNEVYGEETHNTQYGQPTYLQSDAAVDEYGCRADCAWNGAAFRNEQLLDESQQRPAPAVCCSAPGNSVATTQEMSSDGGGDDIAVKSESDPEDDIAVAEAVAAAVDDAVDDAVADAVGDAVKSPALRKFSYPALRSLIKGLERVSVFLRSDEYVILKGQYYSQRS
ncbi:MAG: hypothetical protein GY826_24760 [Fuerstiella sp.]|nr:hypothetical protein [Fuerstiella sp.]